ncbi:MAG TPA: hypothetical protein VGD79_05125 [Thermoanaerobaculia bacterium]|jgi:hypothetical protein
MSRWARFVALVALIATGTPALPEDGGLVSLVPWKVLQPDEVITSPLVLFWIPASPDAMRRSAMLTSDDLTQFSERCVAMRVVRFDDDTRLAKLQVEEDLPIAVLADRDGNILGTVKPRQGRLSVSEVEGLVRDELDARESEAETLLDEARKLAEHGDVEGAQELYERVAEARCLCPRQAKTAAKALKKYLGVRRR